MNGPSESFSIICAILASSVRISISCLQKLVRSRCTSLRQEPLDIWTEHSNCHVHRRGTLKHYSFTDIRNWSTYFVFSEDANLGSVPSIYSEVLGLDNESCNLNLWIFVDIFFL